MGVCLLWLLILHDSSGKGVDSRLLVCHVTPPCSLCVSMSSVRASPKLGSLHKHRVFLPVCLCRDTQHHSCSLGHSHYLETRRWRNLVSVTPSITPCRRLFLSTSGCISLHIAVYHVATSPSFLRSTYPDPIPNYTCSTTQQLTGPSIKKRETGGIGRNSGCPVW